jgi:hypothetical protein
MLVLVFSLAVIAISVVEAIRVSNHLNTENK